MVSVFYPVIEMLTDPDSINQKILAYIQQQPQSEAVSKKAYVYTANFDDFIQMIKSCNDIEVLKHIRYMHLLLLLLN
jgi:sorting nexin-25